MSYGFQAHPDGALIDLLTTNRPIAQAILQQEAQIDQEFTPKRIARQPLSRFQAQILEASQAAEDPVRLGKGSFVVTEPGARAIASYLRTIPVTPKKEERALRKESELQRKLLSLQQDFSKQDQDRKRKLQQAQALSLEQPHISALQTRHLQAVQKRKQHAFTKQQDRLQQRMEQAAAPLSYQRMADAIDAALSSGQSVLQFTAAANEAFALQKTAADTPFTKAFREIGMKTKPFHTTILSESAPMLKRVDQFTKKMKLPMKLPKFPEIRAVRRNLPGSKAFSKTNLNKFRLPSAFK